MFLELFFWILHFAPRRLLGFSVISVWSMKNVVRLLLHNNGEGAKTVTCSSVVWSRPGASTLLCTLPVSRQLSWTPLEVTLLSPLLAPFYRWVNGDPWKWRSLCWVPVSGSNVARSAPSSPAPGMDIPGHATVPPVYEGKQGGAPAWGAEGDPSSLPGGRHCPFPDPARSLLVLCFTFET